MNNQIPAYLANRQGRGIAQQAVAGIMGAQPARISIAGNRFAFVDAAGNTRPALSQYLDQRTGQPVTVQATELRVVVIGANPNPSKLYFKGVYDPNAGDTLPPTCFSDNGIAPSAQASEPQSATCAMCPHNAFGTSRGANGIGGKGKACSDKKKIAVRLTPEYQDDTIYQLQVPPATLKDFSAYMHTTAQQDFGGRPADACDVVTVITFEQGQVGKLNFTWGGFYDEAFAQSIDNDLNTKADKIAWITGTNDRPRVAQLAAPQQPVQQVLSNVPVPQNLALPAPQAYMTAQPPPPVYPQPVQQPVQLPPNVVPMQPAQQAQAAPRTRRPRAGKGGVGQEQQVPATAPVVQSQPATTSGVVTAPVGPAGAPAFLQQQPVQPAAPANGQQFGIQQQPQLASEDVAAKIAAAMAM